MNRQVRSGHIQETKARYQAVVSQMKTKIREQTRCLFWLIDTHGRKKKIIADKKPGTTNYSRIEYNYMNDAIWLNNSKLYDSKIPILNFCRDHLQWHKIPYGHLARTVQKGSKITPCMHTHTQNAKWGNVELWFYHIYKFTNTLIHTLISTSSTVGGTEPLEIHSAVIRANLILSNSEKPLMNIKTFISSSNIFSRYLYRRISLMNTYNTTYTI